MYSFKDLNYFRRKLLLLVSLIFAFNVQGQQKKLSPEAEISVLTIGPGATLNDAFGHSAFRIKDYIKGLDLVFNYGVYDFNTPNFYLKFAQGKLNYLIGLDYYEDFYESYIAQNRTIKEQVLNLSQTEKQKLFDYLANNYKPENRAYLYDFFYDNCATKIKDVLQEATSNSITFKTPKNFEAKTFRSLIHENLDLNSWGAVGIDVALGSVIDRQATPEQHMFLPKNIYRFFGAATVKTDNNKTLVKQKRVLFEKMEQPKQNDFFTSPLFVFGVLGVFILWLTYKDFKNKKRTLWLDVLLFSITGIIGVFILLLWFATDHTGTHQNYNLLWAFALNLLVIPQLLKKQPAKWFIKYLKFLIILLCLLTLHWIIGVQVFAIGLIPFFIALLLRYIYLVKHYRL
ncbi:lipoprotein N-acyltransferase Lnb domain-containing protein [Aestuariivivens insulae]|uniref:lipoprotein N-acyltransferase Lnb domain-containing protein n=1 Tax=Aestuariivivens insulae TaxID=1621988 RepID=UPI001F568BCE|nr:DUF4105 domain-containing protein [Aestuariivivens insulae]